MKWGRVKAFVVKDLKALFRDKATVFWIFIWPLIWVFMVAYVFLPPSIGTPITLDLGVINNDKSEAPFNGTTFVKILDEMKYKDAKLFNIKPYDDEDILISDLKKGVLDAGIIIPNGFGKNLTMGQAHIKVFIGAKDPYSSQVNSAIIMGVIEAFNEQVSLRKINYTITYTPENITIPINETKVPLKEFLQTYLMGIAKPINASFEEVKPEALSSRETIVGWYTLGAVGMLFLYGGFNIGALMAVEEKEKKTLKRVLSTPTSETDLLIGKTIAGLVALGLSATVAIIAGVFACNAKILWDPLNPLHWLVIPLIVATGLMTIGIGIFLSLLSKTVRGASSLATILGLMLAFTAGIWFPKTWMPYWMQLLADIFPVTWAIDAIRSIMVFNIPLNELYQDIIKVFVTTIVIYTLGVIIYKKMIRKYLEE